MRAAVQSQRPLQIVPWVFYTCVVLVACLALTFPYDALRDRVLAEIGSHSGLRISAVEWRLEWPLGFAGHGVTISRQGGWDIRADQVAVAVNTLSLLGGQPQVDVTATLPNRASAEAGIVHAKMVMSSLTGHDGSMSLTGQVERVDLTTLQLKGVAQGLLQGTFEQQWQRSSEGRLVPIGEGNWDAHAENVLLDQLSLGPLTLPTITIAQATATIHCQQTTCQIVTFKGEGPDGSFTGTGQLVLGPSAPQTTVELSLSLSPNVGFVQRLAAAGIPMVAGPTTIRVSGPLTQPTVSL